jgi:hypothetical protein
MIDDATTRYAKLCGMSTSFMYFAQIFLKKIVKSEAFTELKVSALILFTSLEYTTTSWEHELPIYNFCTLKCGQLVKDIHFRF